MLGYLDFSTTAKKTRRVKDLLGFFAGECFFKGTGGAKPPTEIY
jgi:hypothetical protein